MTRKLPSANPTVPCQFYTFFHNTAEIQDIYAFNVSAVPYLVAAPEGPLDPDFGRVLLVLLGGAVELLVEGVAKLPRPRPVRLDVHREEVLVRRRRQRERVVLLRLDRRAGEANPLPGEHLHVRRAVELDFDDVRGQELRLQYVELHVPDGRGEMCKFSMYTVCTYVLVYTEVIIPSPEEARV